MAKKKRLETWEEETRKYIENFHSKSKKIEQIKEYAIKEVKQVAVEVPSKLCGCGFLLRTCNYSYTKRSYYCPECTKTIEGDA